jgi:holin-like protein
VRRCRSRSAIRPTVFSKHLSLLFVPAGVGVVQHLELLLSGAGLRLMAVVVLTTLVTLAVTALVFSALARLLHADALAAGKPESGERP